MRYVDVVYGPASFTDPLIVDLLQSNAVQRLGGVLQHGITALLGRTPPITRLDHSIGAMIVVQRNGGSIDEQAAALLHDVSHTAFSHVVDFVFGGPSGPSFHEEKKREWIAGSDVPAVLSRHGRNWLDFLDDTRFPLLEQPAPRMCADRIDYFLRDALALGLVTLAEVKTMSDGLIVAEGRLAVREVEVGKLFGFKYIEADEAIWSNPTAILLYELTARAIKAALDRSAITQADLWGTDEVLWNKMLSCRDAPVEASIDLVSKFVKFVPDAAAASIRLRPKIRTVDPDVLTADGLIPLSQLDSAFKQYRDDYLKRRASAISLRLAE
jgi:HD superfamily phosphohydrolase